MSLNSHKYVELWENCMWQPLIRNGNLHCVFSMCTVYSPCALCAQNVQCALCVHHACALCNVYSPCAHCFHHMHHVHHVQCVQPRGGAAVCQPAERVIPTQPTATPPTPPPPQLPHTRSATQGTHACWPQGQVVQIMEVCWEQRPRVCRILCGPITNFLSARVLLDKHTWNTAEQTHKHCKHKEPPLHICVWPLGE